VSIIERLPLPPPPAGARPGSVRLARGTEPPPDVMGFWTNEPTVADSPAARHERSPTPHLPHEFDLSAVRLRKSPNYSVWVAGCAGFALAALIFWPRGDHEARTQTGSADAVTIVAENAETPPRAPAMAAEETPPRAPAMVAEELPPKPATKSATPPKRSRPAPPAERRKPRSTPRHAAPSTEGSAKPGLLTLDARPYATIYVDGRKVGDTPIVDLPLSPGEHRVRAVSADGAVRSFRVTIHSGDVMRRRVPSAP